MSTAFTDAITQSMVAGLDPMNGIVKQYAEQTTARSELELDKERNQFTLLLAKQIQHGKDNGMDGNVLDGWQRLLQKHTNKV